MLFNSIKEIFCVTPYEWVIKSRNVFNSINEIISNFHLKVTIKMFSKLLFATHADITEF